MFGSLEGGGDLGLVFAKRHYFHDYAQHPPTLGPAAEADEHAGGVHRMSSS
jgi:hypothetical protein